MTSLKNAVAAAAMVSVVAIASSVSASIPATDGTAVDTSSTSIVLAQAAPEDKRSTSMTEFERQSAILAPKEGDHKRLYTLGGLGALVLVLFGLVAINRNKWGKPQA